MVEGTDIRSPEFHPFWQDFRLRLLAVARTICRDCKLPLRSDPDDFAHEALICAINLVSARLTGKTVTLELLEQLRVEAYRVARTSMKHDFLDEVRSILRQQGLLTSHTQLSTETEGNAGVGRSRVSTPEEFASAIDLAKGFAEASRSPKNKAFAEAALMIARHGGENIDGKDLTSATGLSSSDLADFRRVVKKRLRAIGSPNSR